MLRNKFLLVVLLTFTSIILLGSYKVPTIGYKGNNNKAELIINDRSVLTIYSTYNSLTPLERVKKIALRLNQALFSRELRPDKLSVALNKGEYIGVFNKEELFVADKESAKVYKMSSQNLALKWIKDIRIALGDKTYSQPSRSIRFGQNDYFTKSYIGLASWYGGHFNKRKTASGKIYNVNEFTAAHKTLPFGTKVLITNLMNGKSVVVTITDRGPFKGPNRIIDLSPVAFKKIGNLNNGLLRIRLDVLN